VLPTSLPTIVSPSVVRTTACSAARQPAPAPVIPQGSLVLARSIQVRPEDHMMPSLNRSSIEGLGGSFFRGSGQADDCALLRLLQFSRCIAGALDASEFMELFAINERARHSHPEAREGPCGAESRAPWMCRT